MFKSDYSTCLAKLSHEALQLITKVSKSQFKLTPFTRNPFPNFPAFNPSCAQPLHEQRRNAWAHVCRTCSSPTICLLWRSWRCSPACPASSKTPVTCRRPCWMISECARVTPSSVISCSGSRFKLQHTPAVNTLLDRGALNEHLCDLLCAQAGADQGG